MTDTTLAPVPGKQLLRMPDVRRKTRLGRTTIYRLEAAGLFPRRLKLGLSAVAWDADEIDQWIASRARSGTVLA